MDTSEPPQPLDPAATELPTIASVSADNWDAMLRSSAVADIEGAIANEIVRRRWFGSKSRTLRAARIVDALTMSLQACIALVSVEFDAVDSEIYQICLGLAFGEAADRLLAGERESVWARVRRSNAAETALIYNPLSDGEFCGQLLELFDSVSRQTVRGGQFQAWQSASYRRLRGELPTLPARIVPAEQSNSSVIYGNRLILKLFRRVETGLNPDVEVNAYLTERGFAHVPATVGAIEYRGEGQAPWCLAMLQAYVENEGDAWQFTLQKLELVLDRLPSDWPPSIGVDGLSSWSEVPIPSPVSQPFEDSLRDAGMLGKRTGQMHMALAADGGNPDFAPEPFSANDQRRYVEGNLAFARETFDLLREQMPRLSPDIAARALDVLQRQPVLETRFQSLTAQTLEVARIRCHGDYHLGQVLVANGDFVIIDFEGEPARPLTERRDKRVALVDVAGMIRSYHYASRVAASNARRTRPPAEAAVMDRWAAAWYFWNSVAFLQGYRATVGNAAFAPRNGEDYRRLLDACLLAKAVYELRYELNNRPDWVYLPLEALSEL